ncbi:MAG: TatD family hydrolase [Sinobacterium sp.]|nr:TatD family hydrolase [Sinobacterium sp.]
MSALLPTTHNLWCDSHCHLDLIKTNNKLQRLQQLSHNHCSAILIPSTEGRPSPQATEFYEASKHIATLNVFTSFGYHPWFLDSLKHLDSTELFPYILNAFNQADKISAIGETGLDRLKADNNQAFSLQLQCFNAHCLLALETQLPLIIHSVKSHADTHETLRHYKGQLRGVIHGFTGSYEQAMQFINLGFFIGVGGSISYPRAKKTREAIRRLPLESLLLETDAPAMPLFTQQGSDNKPENIVLIADALAEIKQCPTEHIIKCCTANFQRLFSHD